MSMTFKGEWVLLILLIQQQLKISSYPLDQFLYITVKSTESNHNSRLTALQNTWFKDLKPSEINIVTDSDRDLNGWLRTRGVLTECGKTHGRRDLVCKLEKELQLFKQTNAKWSCHFDDDSYVNVKKLKYLLSGYDANQKYYIGKSSTGPIKLGEHHNLMFGTGGAGYCLSRAVLNELDKEKIKGLSRLSEEIGMPDDMTLAVFLDKIANVQLNYQPEFHSHLESHQIHLNDLQYQVVLARTVIPTSFSAEKLMWMYKLDCFLNPDRCKHEE